MDREQVFNIWAPPGGPWSLWVKPVLFAHINPTFLPADVPMYRPEDAAMLPQADGRCALVIDLPGAPGVSLGMAAASKGFRPVPLYNALPSPTGFLQGNAPVVVDVQPILYALEAATPALDELNLPYASPPAFLLDSRRRFGTPVPGMFDNRSVSLPTDFPSANRLRAMGIERVILIQGGGSGILPGWETFSSAAPQEDLCHTLLRWQEGGIEIQMLRLDQPTPPVVIQIRKPSRYRSVWQRMLATVGLRKSPLGGFGGILPIPSSAG